MLNLIIKKYPNSKYFGWKGFIDTKKEYSEYFLQEIRNELSGHVEDDFIDQSVRFLKQFNKFKFSFYDIQAFHKDNSSLYPSINIEHLLSTLFKFNMVGNYWYNEYKRKDYYCWSHRDPKADVDFNKNFVLHLGVRESISK
jgi:hypothetical protein